MTATNGASVCAYVRAILNTTRENSNPQFLRISKASAQYRIGTPPVNLRNADVHISRNACVPPFQLVTPPELKATTSRRGTLHVCRYVPNQLFLYISHVFCSGRGSFLAPSAVRHTGGPPVRWAQVWAPAGLRSARSGRSNSR